MKTIRSLIRGWWLPIPILLLLACGANDSEEAFEYANFDSVDSLEVVLPDAYNLLTTFWTTYQTDHTTRLVEYGLGNNGDLIIYQIDFTLEEYLEPIVIPKDGPDGFNSSTASVYFKGADSIYVFPAAKSSFFLFNSNGKKIGKYDYNADAYERHVKDGFYSNIIYLENQLVFTTHNDVRWDDPEYFKKILPIHFYDLASSQFVAFIEFPEYTKGWEGWEIKSPGPQLAKIDENSFLVNYGFSDSLFVYDINTQSMKSLYCGSDVFGKHKLHAKPPEQWDQIKYLLKGMEYQSVFYHQGKIYRLVNHLIDQAYYNYSIQDIVGLNLRAVSLIEMDVQTAELKFYKMPLTKYFVFDKEHLYVGSISSREDEAQTTYRTFYKYALNTK